MPTEELKMTVAKASNKDIKHTRRFMHLCEALLESSPYSLSDPARGWEDFDEDDEEYKKALRIREEIAEEEGISETAVDHRLIAYELLKWKFREASNSWGRVIMAADVLIDTIVPASSTILEFHPGFEFNHVDKEQ